MLIARGSKLEACSFQLAAPYPAVQECDATEASCLFKCRVHKNYLSIYSYACYFGG